MSPALAGRFFTTRSTWETCGLEAVVKVKVKSLSRVWLFATPCTVTYQAPPSMGFSRQECWGGLPFPSPGDLPDPGIEPGSPTLQADALPSEPLGKPFFHWSVFYLQYYINFKGPMYWFDILIDYTSYKVVIKCSLYFLCYNYILVSYFMPSCL